MPLVLGRRASYVDFERFESKVADLRRAFKAGNPWQHAVFDGALNPDAARRAAVAFPRLGAVRTLLARILEARSHGRRPEEAGSPFAEIYDDIFSERFVALLETITGIAGLEPDRENVGAGLHQGVRGSYLRLHADHNTHPDDATRYRRVNVLLYLNERWEPEWNGDLELWDRDAAACRKKIAPLFNRCVVLDVDDSSFHGYGKLRLPRGTGRKVLAAYYYAKLPALGQARAAHGTVFPPIRSERPIQALNHKLRRVALFHFERLLSGAPFRKIRKDAIAR